ncbi:hypothetical protein Lser_V15G03323 [Lactuca serriola]
MTEADKKRVVQLWLNNFHDLAYDIDDVLDDLVTEAIQFKLDREYDSNTNPNSSSSKGFKFIPTCFTNFSPSYGSRLSSKLDEITTKLNDLVEVKKCLGFAVNVNVDNSNRIEIRLQQTSLVDESKIIGGDGDKEALLGKLLGNDEKKRIVSIVGMGGIGKSTLAKVLYKEEKVNEGSL